MGRPSKKSTELTKAELEIMQILWDLEYVQGTVNDILLRMSEPKPAYNTVSTIVRILVDKGYLETIGNGKSHIYVAKVTKNNYANKAATSILSAFFDNSVANMVSHFAKNEELSQKEIDQIKKLLNK